MNDECTVAICTATATHKGTISVSEDRHIVPVRYCDDHTEGFRKLEREFPDLFAVNMERITS